MIQIVAIVIGVASSAWAFYSHIWAWSLLVIAAILLVVTYVGNERRTRPYVADLSPTANFLLQKFGSYYTMPAAARDFSGATSTIQFSAIAVATIGATQGHYWGFGVAAMFYFGLGPVALAFNPTNFIRGSKFADAHREVIDWAKYSSRNGDDNASEVDNTTPVPPEPSENASEASSATSEPNERGASLRDDLMKELFPNRSEHGAGLGVGLMANPELRRAQDRLDDYLRHFGASPPESVTLDPYDWAQIDLMLRSVSNGSATLHSHEYNGVVLVCKGGLCYCHALTATVESTEIVKQIHNYISAMKGNIPSTIAIDKMDRRVLNNHFHQMFGEQLSLDTNPQLAFRLINISGEELYKVRDA